MYISAQTPVLTGGSTATALKMDVYRATGMPTSTVTWSPLHLNDTATLHAARGFVFVNATMLYVCDNGYGLRRFRFVAPSWVADPVTYIADPTDANITQIALYSDGYTLYAVTPFNMYGFDTNLLLWLNYGFPLQTAASNTQFRGIALAPALPTPSQTTTPTQSGTATQTASITATRTPTRTRSNTASSTGSGSGSVSNTGSETASPSSSVSFGQTPSNSPSSTGSPSNTPSHTATGTSTRTASPPVTLTTTASITVTGTQTASTTSTGSWTSSKTISPTRTASNTPTSTPSATFIIAPFRPNNVLISRVGDGSSALGLNTQPVFIDEYSTGGALAQSVIMPIGNGVGAVTNALTMPGQNPLLCLAANSPNTPGTAGLLTRSQNGQLVTIFGNSVPVGTTWTSAAIYWSIARMQYNGTIDTVTHPLQHHGGDVFYNAVRHCSGCFSFFV